MNGAAASVMPGAATERARPLRRDEPATRSRQPLVALLHPRRPARACDRELAVCRGPCSARAPMLGRSIVVVGAIVALALGCSSSDDVAAQTSSGEVAASSAGTGGAAGAPST